MALALRKTAGSWCRGCAGCGRVWLLMLQSHLAMRCHEHATRWLCMQQSKLSAAAYLLPQ